MKHIGFNRLQMAKRAAFLCLFVLVNQVGAQQSSGTKSQPAAKPESAPASLAPQQPSAPTQSPTLAQFGWLKGQWRGEWGSRIAEQTWLEPNAGETAGLFRLIEGQKILVLEIFSLVEKPQGVQLYLRHLTPDLLPWEKSDATVLKLESVDATKATFLNPVDGEPKRTIFMRLDADTYTSRSEIEPAEGEPQVIEITFHRQKPQPAAVSAGSAGHQKKP